MALIEHENAQDDGAHVVTSITVVCFCHCCRAEISTMVALPRETGETFVWIGRATATNSKTVCDTVRSHMHFGANTVLR